MRSKKSRQTWCGLGVVLIMQAAFGSMRNERVQKEVELYENIIKPFMPSITYYYWRSDPTWINVTSPLFATQSTKPIGLFSLIEEKIDVQKIKEKLVDSYKIHVMPKPAYMIETITRILQHVIKDQTFAHKLTGIKAQLLPLTHGAISDQQMMPLIVVYPDPAQGKECAQSVLNTLTRLLEDIPQIELSDIDPQKVALLKDTRTLCPRFNLPAIPTKHLICYAQGEGYEKEIKGFLLSKNPINVKEIYKTLPLADHNTTFVDVDIPCKNTLIAQVAGYQSCSEIQHHRYKQLREKLIAQNIPTETIDKDPQLLAIFFDKKSIFSFTLLAQEVKPDASNLMTGEQIKELLENALRQAKENPESARAKYTEDNLKILHNSYFVTKSISFAEMFLSQDDNFALYSADFTGTIRDYHLYP